MRLRGAVDSRLIGGEVGEVVVEVLDSDGRGVACDHRGAAPTAGGLHGGGRGAAADELRGQPPAGGVRRDALEAEHGGEDLDAA